MPALILALALALTACASSAGSAPTSPPGATPARTAGGTPGGTGTSGAVSPGGADTATPSVPSAAPGGNPFAASPPYAWPSTAAGVAASDVTGPDAQLIARIAATPTAVWLTPEQYPQSDVGAFVRSVVAGAGEAATPLFVIYGITDRDCASGQSSGGLAPQRYLSWVRTIAAAAGPRSAVILEPDALASAPQCGNIPEREGLMRRAVSLLASGPTVYLDAGHANWVPADQMAQMLQASGVDQTRGFSLNVSSYDSSASEEQYAEDLRSRLSDAHYVIDTGRNGNGGAGADGEWCNAPGQALGHAPAVGDAPGLDAYLWIKPPGESDGSCHGAPPAGQFWVAGAAALARRAGW